MINCWHKAHLGVAKGGSLCHVIMIGPVVSPFVQCTIPATLLVVVAAFHGGHGLNMDFKKSILRSPHLELAGHGLSMGFNMPILRSPGTALMLQQWL